MDIYRIIESDHALLRGLLDRIAAARNPDWRYQLCRELAQVLHVHSSAKRVAFYDRLAGEPRLAGRVAQLQEEQDIAASFLKEALGLGVEGIGFDRLVREGRAEIMRSIDGEAQSLFPQVRAYFDDLQALRAGQHMRALKDELIEAEYMGSPSLRADAGYYS